MADINLVVARADLAGGVELTPEAPPRVEGKQGGTLAVKFPYKYVEVSTADDHFRIQLTSDLGGKQAEPGTYDHIDRRGVADDVRGFVSQEYKLETPGEHTLNWRAAVEFTDGPQKSMQDLQGTVTVAVAPAAPAPL